MEEKAVVAVSFQRSDEKPFEVIIKDNEISRTKKHPGATHRSYGSTITSRRLAFINKLKDKDFKVVPNYSDEGAEVSLEISF